jgi:hypothetical protein
MDSVELSNTRAVTIGHVAGSGGYLVSVWRLRDAAGAPILDRLQTSFGLGDDAPHDLAMSRDGTKAVVRTRDHILVLWDLDLSSGGFLTAIPVTSSPYHGIGAGAPQSSASFVSDSVVIGPVFTYTPYSPEPPYTRQYAFTLGARLRTDLSPARDVTEVHVVNVLSNPPQLVQMFEIGDSSSDAYDTRPADLVLANGGIDVALRNFAPPEEDQPELGGRDFARFLMSPLQLDTQYGSSGNQANAIDSIVFARGFAFSISQKDTLVGQPIRGYVHSVKMTY